MSKRRARGRGCWAEFSYLCAIRLLMIGDILLMILKGVFIGVAASVPLGPVGVLCLQRTLHKGRLYGLVTGLGAAASDLTYALITGMGMLPIVMHWVEDERTKLFLQLVGSGLLLFFGFYVFLSRPPKPHAPSGQRGTLWQNFLTGLLLTLSNPLIILLFIVLFARFAFVCPGKAWLQMIGYVAMVAGSCSWWFGLSYAVDKVRKNFSMRYILMLNRTIGIVVIAAAVGGFVFTLLGLRPPGVLTGE